jgi:arginase
MNNKLDELTPGSVAMLGLPLDENSSFLRGPALGPSRIRQALHSGSAHWTTELGVDLSATTSWHDLGDLALGHGDEAFAQIEAAAELVLGRGARLLALGGDHSVSYPLLRAHSRHFPGLVVLHIDAHNDLYDELDGSRRSHACPFARLMEQGLLGRLVQVGIRAMTPHLRQQVERFGVEVIDMRAWMRGARPAIDGPFYLSLDLDALDPAFAPGVSHHEPGGLSTREVLSLIQELPGPILGADIVEYNPPRDWMDMTAMLAAKFCKEICGRIISPGDRAGSQAGNFA